MALRHCMQTKLTTAIVVALASIIAINVIAIWMLVKRTNDMSAVMDSNVSASRAVQQLNFEFKTQVQEWKNTLLRGNETANREKYWGRFKDWQQRIQHQKPVLIQSVTDGQAKQGISNFFDQHQRIVTEYDRAYRAFVDSAGFDARVGDQLVRGIDRQPSQYLQLVNDRLGEIALESIEHLRKDVVSVRNWSLVLSVLPALAVAALLIWALRLQLFDPLTKAIRFLQQFSTGDLRRLPDITARQNDELGQLLNNLDELNQSTVARVHEVRRLSGDIESASSQMKDAAENTSMSTHKAMENSEQVVTALQQMGASVQEIANNASSASQTAMQVDESATQGLGLMDQALDSMEKMMSYHTEVSGAVGQLEKDVAKVGSVLDVIEGVAEQTNLLALNAAIEAARAGEQGRGFAVVADEVRNLAQRTQELTDEVHSIINNINDGTVASVKALEKSESHTENTLSATHDVSTALKAIAHGVGDILSVNTQIAAATEEQSAVTQDIRRNIEVLAEVIKQASQNSQYSVEVAAHLGEISEKMTAMAAHYQV